MQKKSNFLSNAELKALLVRPEHNDLLKFTRGFYQLLLQANPERRTFARSEENRQLEILARLLVGDEICSAAAFFDQQLVIATNRPNHEDTKVTPKLLLTILPGSSLRKGFFLQISGSVHIHAGDKDVTVPILMNPTRYIYNEKEDSLTPTSEIIDISVTPEQHKLERAQTFTHSMSLATFDKIHTTLLPAIKVSHQEAMEGLRGSIISPIPLIDTKIDPLRRRTDILLIYLSCLVRSEAQESLEERLKDKKGLGLTRERFLLQSLSWEAAKLLNRNEPLRDYVTQHKEDPKEIFDKFIVLLHNDFLKFKTEKKLPYVSRSQVEEWAKPWLASARKKKIAEVASLGSITERIVDAAARYFSDLEELEKFALAQLKSKGAFYRFLMTVSPFKETPVLILDEQEHDVHAEIRLLTYFLERKKRPEFVAIGRLCCAHCTLTMAQTQIKEICGTHGKAYPKWRLTSLLQQPEWLQIFLGKELFEQFRQLKNPELALQIIESIGGLELKDLLELKIAERSLFHKERAVSEFPDVANAAQSNSTKNPPSAKAQAKSPPTPTSALSPTPTSNASNMLTHFKPATEAPVIDQQISSDTFKPAGI